jgi:hypothetical protein
MAITYKIVTIEQFDDDIATENALNAEGISDWELIQIFFRPTETDGSQTATCIFKK